MKEYGTGITLNHTFFRVIALVLSLSLLFGIASCAKKPSLPSAKDAKHAVEDEYDMDFELESKDISKDESKATWIFISEDGTLRVTASWNSKNPDKFKFKEEAIDVSEPTETTEKTEKTYATEPTDPTESTAESRKNRDGLIKLGIINSDPNESSYRTANDKDMKRTFTKENGYDAMYFYSLKGGEQVSAAEKFIEDGVDYLLISACNVDGWTEVLQKAKAAGIKVILFDRSVDVDESLYEALVVADMAKSGRQAVEWLRSQKRGKYNIIHLQGIEGSSAQIGRSGALNSIAASDPEWNIVVQKSAEWTAQKAEDIVSSAISSKKSFNVIFAESEDMAKGAVAALDKAKISHGMGKDVIVVTFGGSTWALNEVLAGKWNLLVHDNPFQGAYIDDIIKNGAKQKVVIIDNMEFNCNNITQNDVDNYGM